MKPNILTSAVLALLLAGCSSMLPRGSTDQTSKFASYAEAQSAAERIVPFETHTAQLGDFGFDPHEGSNVTLIPYPEIVARLAPYSGVPLDQLDPGIKACILARTACRAYLFHFEKQDRERQGSFLIDFFNVRRETKVTGWWFEALVVVDDGTVLFRNVAGQPHVERIDMQRNPLGPFQPAGEAAGAAILR